MNNTFCPYCLININYVEKIKREEFETGHPIKCDKCSVKFNIFEVLRFIAINIQEAETMISECSEIIFSNWKITDGTDDENNKIKSFMSKSFSEIFLKEIINDCLMWGSCFIKHEKINGEIKLEIIDPCDYKIITEHEFSSGSSGVYLGEKVKSMINYKTDYELPKSNLCIVYLHSHMGGFIDLGFTALGYWFITWLNILLAKNILSNSNHSSQNEELRKYLDDMIPSTQHQIAEKIDNGRRSRSSLASSISHEIFSLITPREETTISERMKDDYVSPPRLKFLKDQ